MSIVSDLSEPTKHAVDALSIGAFVATIFNRLPEVTAVAVLIWTCLRIYEAILTIRQKRREMSE